MGPAMSVYFYQTSIMLTLFVSGIRTAPSETDSALLSKNHDSQAIDVPDSPLERVQVQRESGFDGRVRSIRFNFEPEQDCRRNEGINKQRLFSPFNDYNYHPTRSNYNQNIGQPIISNGEASQQLPLFESMSSATMKPSRMKRETEKHLPKNEADDLETAEAKVFRPLFVYRQQISRRLRLQNDKQSNKNLRQIRTRTKPSIRRYYYPYRYYYPSNTYFF